WFTLIVSLLLIFIFYKFTSKLGTAINQLREFAKRADKNEPVKQICTPPYRITLLLSGYFSAYTQHEHEQYTFNIKKTSFKNIIPYIVCVVCNTKVDNSI
ncbi:hypothetical protein PZH42_29665, partial [Bacteroides cellulosilyticus]